MRRQDIIHTFLFVVFFCIGATAVSVSLLCDDLQRYYHNRQLLRMNEQLSDRLRSLNADYDVLLQQFRDDPNFVERIAPATLGKAPEDEDISYPRATIENLAAAEQALRGPNKQLAKPPTPGWLTRCRQPLRRIFLFLSGACLVLVSLLWFGPARQTRRG